MSDRLEAQLEAVRAREEAAFLASGLPQDDSHFAGFLLLKLLQSEQRVGGIGYRRAALKRRQTP